MPRSRSTTSLASLAALALAVLLSLHLRPASAYVEIPYTLGRLVNESTHIMTLKVEKVDKANRRIIFSKVTDLKGKHPQNEVKHVINNGFEEREWKTIMNWAEPGKTAVFFHNGGAGECCIDGYWYQIYPGEWWSMSHAEPYLGRSFHGKPDKLAGIVTQMLAGQEVLVPCMVDGDKNALKAGTAKIQRLKNSLKIMDYNPARDFAGWGGNDDFRKLTGMPGFNQFGQLPQVGPGAAGVTSADFDGDAKLDLCLFGETRVVLLQNGGNTMNETSLPYSGPARAAEFADYNGDGKPDLLLATPTGPRLFTNAGNGTFKDDTRGLPVENYYNCTAAAFIDADGDKRPDILLANGFLGLRLYRNIAAADAKPTTPVLSNWHVIGPFDNAGNVGFDKAYAPEQKVDLAAEHVGKGNRKLKWQKKDFADATVHSLAIFEDNNEGVAYLYRELDYGPAAFDLPISLGSDDSLKVFLNGKQVLAENVSRGAAADSNLLTLKLQPGKNQLLLKIGQGSGDWGFYFAVKSDAKPVGAPLFEDVTDRMKLGPDGVAGSVKGDRIVVQDVNGDGRADFLYTAGTGVLALNTPEGFVEAKEAGLRFQTGGITPLFGDFNGDKRPDLLVPQKDGCKLFVNAGTPGTVKFTDATAASGDLAKLTGQPTSAALASFKKGEQAGVLIGCLKGPNRYLKNAGGGKFVDASDELGLATRVFNTRGVWVGDLNKKNALDMVFNNEGQDSAVLLGDPDKVAMKE